MSGLKGQWGVDEPAQAGSDEQSNKFKADFQAELGRTNEHLQYTAAHADSAEHAPMSAKRDALTPAFQSALAQIDPANAGKAQGAIDTVLANARSVGAEVAAFREAAEKAYDSWQQRQPAFDTAIGQIEELEAWEDPKAPTLRTVAGMIQKQVDQRQYAPAGTALDQLQPTLQPIYEEYQKQKAAKEQFEPLLADLQPRVTDAMVDKYAKLKPKQTEIAAGQGTMDAAAAKKDFVQALVLVGELGTRVDAYQAALDEVDQQKAAYEQALLPVQSRVQSVKVSEPQYTKLQPQQQAIAAAQSDMEASVQAEDFVQALAQVQDISAKLDALDAAKAEIDRLKQEYETALAALQPRLEAAAAATEPQYAKLQQQQQEIATARAAMEAAAQAGDYEQANTALQDLGPKLDVFDAAKTEIDEQKLAYETALAELQPRLQAVSASDPQYAKLQPQQAAIAQGQSAMQAAAQAGDYSQATTLLEELRSKLDAYEQAQAEVDRLKQEYEAALAALQPRLEAAAAATEPQYAKLQQQQQEIATARAAMEAAAQGGDYEQASTSLQELGTKLDGFDEAKTGIDEQKKDYEAALAELQPRLEAVSSSDARFAKLQSQQQALLKVQTDMEAAAQAGDYARARELAADVGGKLDEFEAALKDIEGKKDEFETAWKELREKFEGAAKAPAKKLEDAYAAIAKDKADMDARAAAEDYEGALAIVQAMGPKLAAYETATGAWAAQKTEYDGLLPSLQPRLAKAAAVKNEKLKAKQEALGTGQQGMEAAALIGDYDVALTSAKDLTTQLDAFEKEGAGASLLELGGEVTIKEWELVKQSFAYAKGAAKVGGSAKFGPAADAEPGSATKEQVSQTVLEKASDVISKGKWDLTGGLKVNPKDKQVSLAVNATFSCEWGPAKLEFAPAELSLLSIDPKDGVSGPKVALANAAFSLKPPGAAVEVGGCKIELSFAGSFTIEITPDYVAIGQYVLKQLAIETAEGVIAVDAAALASAAAAVALPLAAAAAIGYGMYQEARNMEASRTAIATALPARKKAAQAAASYAKVLTGSSGGADEGSQHAESQIAQIMAQLHATREEVVEAVKKAQGGYAAIRGKELQRLKDTMYAQACSSFDEGHKEDFGFIERQGPDWGYRGSFRSMLRLILYADD